jgi:hypothetical protein
MAGKGGKKGGFWENRGKKTEKDHAILKRDHAVLKKTHAIYFQTHVIFFALYKKTKCIQ